MYFPPLLGLKIPILLCVFDVFAPLWAFYNPEVHFLHQQAYYLAQLILCRLMSLWGFGLGTTNCSGPNSVSLLIAGSSLACGWMSTPLALATTLSPPCGAPIRHRPPQTSSLSTDNGLNASRYRLGFILEYLIIIQLLLMAMSPVGSPRAEVHLIWCHVRAALDMGTAVLNTICLNVAFWWLNCSSYCHVCAKSVIASFASVGGPRLFGCLGV